MSAIRSVLKSVPNLDVALSPVHDVPSEQAAPEYRVVLRPLLVQGGKEAEVTVIILISALILLPS